MPTSSASPAIMASMAIWTSLVAGKHEIGKFGAKIKDQRWDRYLFLYPDIAL